MPERHITYLHKLAHETFTYSEGRLCRISDDPRSEYLKSHVAPKPKPPCLNSAGFGRVSLRGERYQESRVVYLMHHKELPAIINHIDGDKLNNRIENLRAATHTQLMQSRGPSKGSASGFKGVCPSHRNKRGEVVSWAANCRGICLQTSKTAKKAAHVYDMYALFNLPDDLVTFAYFNFQKGGIPTLEGIEAARDHWANEEL